MTSNVKINARKALYIVGALVGAVATIAGTLGYPEVAEIAAKGAGFLIMLSGGTAIANIQRAPDKQADQEKLAETAEAAVLSATGVAAEVNTAANTIVAELRRVFPVAGSLAAAKVDLPVYDGPTSTPEV